MDAENTVKEGTEERVAMGPEDLEAYEETDGLVMDFEAYEEEHGITTVDQALRLHFLMTKAIGTTSGKDHYWAYYLTEKLKRIVKTYHATIAKHPDHVAYNSAESRELPEVKLREKFPEYVAFFEGLKEEELPESFEKLRPFKAVWCKTHAPNMFITAALGEFGLLDDPDALEEWLFSEEEKEK